jgi:hypothetical protein
VDYDGARLQNCIVEKICTTGDQSLMSLLCISEKNFSFHFKSYNLTICEVNFNEKICTFSPSSLRQDLMVKFPIINKLFLFLLLELELANLSIFLRKMTFVL